MELILSLAHLPVGVNAYDDALELASLADDAGVDVLSLTDHVLLGPNLDSHAALGALFPWPPDHPYPDPLVLLAGMAAVTSRVRLTTGVLIAPLRPAALLAKMAATLDVLSKGRFELGVGSGWQREEFEAVGVPMAERAARTEDAVVACRALWSEDAATVTRPSVTFADMRCRPQPFRARRLPVWFAGGANRATARRVAELGDGWLPLHSDVETLHHGRALLDEACHRVGRDPSEVGVRVMIPGPVDPSDPGAHERLLLLRQAGVTGVSVLLAGQPGDRGADVVEALVDLLARVAR